LLIGLVAAIGALVVIARPWITLVPAIFQHGPGPGNAQPPPLHP